MPPRRSANSRNMSWRTPSALTPPMIHGVPAQAVTIAVAAAMLGISEKSIRRLIDSGDLPARKLPSGGIQIRIVDLDELGEPIAPRFGRAAA